MELGSNDEIVFEEDSPAGFITLTREAALNALTHTMVNGIWSILNRWEADQSIRHVVIRARGRAFSAGGDLLDLYNQGRSGNHHFEFFQDEYRLNARLGIYPKPIVSLIDGIVMGGGVGVSVHGRYRVMTENAVFSMPEVGIGFFPDVGGSYFLSRLPGRMGFYLGLTGARIRAAEALRSGIATHVVSAERLPALEADLAAGGAAEDVLRDYNQPSSVPAPKLDTAEIEHLFSGNSLGDIIETLENATNSSEIAATALKAMRRAAPLSLAVAFRQIEEGAGKSLAECMQMEYRILYRMLQASDFYEGIRSVIVDKTNDPKWNPQSLEEVTEAAVDSYFCSLGQADLTDIPGLA